MPNGEEGCRDAKGCDGRCLRCGVKLFGLFGGSADGGVFLHFSEQSGIDLYFSEQTGIDLYFSEQTGVDLFSFLCLALFFDTKNEMQSDFGCRVPWNTDFSRRNILFFAS